MSDGADAEPACLLDLDVDRVLEPFREDVVMVAVVVVQPDSRSSASATPDGKANESRA